MWHHDYLHQQQAKTFWVAVRPGLVYRIPRDTVRQSNKKRRVSLSHSSPIQRSPAYPIMFVRPSFPVVLSSVKAQLDTALEPSKGWISNKPERHKLVIGSGSSDSLFSDSPPPKSEFVSHNGKSNATGRALRQRRQGIIAMRASAFVVATGTCVLVDRSCELRGV